MDAFARLLRSGWELGREAWWVARCLPRLALLVVCLAVGLWVAGSHLPALGSGLGLGLLLGWPAAGDRWVDHGLVFPTRVGTEMDKDNARRGFRSALELVQGIDPEEWSPRELRHSFVSLLSDSGVALEEISRLVGHSGTSGTELVYRHQIRPVIQTGAVVMDTLFGVESDQNSDR